MTCAPRIPVMQRIALLAGAVLAMLLGPAPADAQDRKELIVWGAWRRPGYEAAYKLFEREHPQWKVVTSSGATAGRMDPQKLMCGIAGGSPPDTLIQDRFSVGEWAARDTFMALDDFVAESLRQEQWARQAAAALARGEFPAARAPLEKLIASLDPIGPSRQRRIARDLLAAARAGTLTESQKAMPAELISLCQGVDARKFYRACWQEACYGEGPARRVYAVPNTTDCRALFYNEDILESVGGICVGPDGKAKPPADWKELEAYALALTRRAPGGKLSRLGFAPNYGNSWLYIYGWLNGGQFMSPDGRTCTLNEPRVIEALEYMVRVYDQLGGMESVSKFQESLQGGEFDPFVTGKVAMKIDGDWFQNTIANYRPTLRFRVVPAPAPAGKKSVTWSGGFSWAIPHGAKHPRLAFEMIRFLMTDRTWKVIHRVEARYSASQGRSYVPQMAPMSHINNWARRELVESNPDLPPRIAKHFQMFSELMKLSKFRPVTPVGQKLWDEHARAFDKAVRHQYKPKKALDIGTLAVQAELDRLHETRPRMEVNWYWPIGAVVLLLVAGAIYAFLRHGRMDLVRRIGQQQSIAGYLFAAPWMLGFLVFTAGPIVVSVIYSLCRYDVLHPAQFVGLDNYRRVASDAMFWRSLGNTGYMVLGIPLGMAAGLGVAMLLNTKVRGMQIYRTIFYLPAIVPIVASSVLWIWVLNAESGLINSMLKMFGATDTPPWLSGMDFDPEKGWQMGAKSAIIVMGLWGAGAGMIIWLAGLKGIPQHLYEAAKIDGAGPWERFQHVTLPVLSPYIFFNLIMGTIGTLQIFAQAYVMTDPSRPNDAMKFYAYYLFDNAFRYFKMGYASAMAWILFLIILLLTLIQLKLAPKWVHYEAD